MIGIPRKDPFLNEAIEILDAHLVRCKRDLSLAFNTLSSVYSEFVNEEIAKCMTNPRYYLENYHIVKTKNDGFKTLYPFWDSQEIIYSEIMGLLAVGKPAKILIDKARQLGSSTLSEGLIFHHTIFTEANNTLIVAQDPGQADYLFSMSMLAFKNLPWWLQPMVLYRSKGRYLVLGSEIPGMTGLNSEIFVEAANKLSGVSVGKTIHCAHLCLTDKNPVLLADGFVKSIADVRAGDRIRGTDGFVTVLNTAVREESNLGYRITPWCNSAFPVEGTGNHEVLVGKINRYWKCRHRVDSVRLKPLSELTKKDALIIPVRPLSSEGVLPATTTTKPRKQGGGNQGGKIYQPSATREWGFVVGLYLAEGSVTPSVHGTVNQVCISLNDDEAEMADRFAAACGVSYGKVTRNKDGSRTRIYHFYNCQLARWIYDNLGRKDEKRLPDWAWTVGREFLAGVVDGMISGDGHITPGKPEIYFTSSRHQLSCQLRDAVLSLGHGYAGIYYQPPGVYYGRNCNESWVLCFGKEPGISMRAEYGWPTAPSKIHNQGSHWMYGSDKKSVAVRIRAIEKIKLDLVYDIEIDANNHLFRLPAATTHNSELSSWDNAKILTEQIFPAMSGNNVIAILESTARGRNGFWYDFWCESIESWGEEDWEWKPVFVEWFRCREYSVPIENKAAFELTEEETAIRAKIQNASDYTIPDEQFNWRRIKRKETIKITGDDTSFLQEYPITHQESFQTSGLCAFPKKLLQEIMNTSCCDPLWYGEMAYSHGAAQEIKLHLTATFDEVEKNRTGNTVYKRDRVIPPAKKYGGRLRVWEQPEAGEAYYVAGDPAHGLEGGDFSCAEVMKIGHGMEPDAQVAEWHGWINPSPFGHILVGLAKWYNGAELSLELNAVGERTYIEVFRILEYSNLFRWKHYDKVKNFWSDYMAWLTTSKTRDLIITNMRERIMEKNVILRSYDLLDQMMDFSSEEEGSKFEGQNTNDDRVMSSMICLWCAHDSDYGKQAAMVPKADGGHKKYYVIDDVNRVVFTSEQKDEAYAAAYVKTEARNVKGEVIPTHAVMRPGWSVAHRPNKKDFNNSDFSPVHDKAGPRAQIHAYGVPAESIRLDNLQDWETMRSSQDTDRSWMEI